MDDALLAVLLAIRSTWEKGEIYVQCAFESAHVLQQALSVIFCGRALVLHLPSKAQVAEIEPLMSLASVQSCTELWLFGPKGRMLQGMYDLSAEDMAEWLHLSVKPGQKRQLVTRDYLTARVRFDLQQLIRLLLQVNAANISVSCLSFRNLPQLRPHTSTKQNLRHSASMQQTLTEPLSKTPTLTVRLRKSSRFR